MNPILQTPSGHEPDSVKKSIRGESPIVESGITLCGQPVVYGVREPMPILNAPSGRYRLRMRNRNFARLFVRTPSSIRVFALLDKGDYWEPCYEAEQGRNERWEQEAPQPSASNLCASAFACPSVPSEPLRLRENSHSQ